MLSWFLFDLFSWTSLMSRKSWMEKITSQSILFTRFIWSMKRCYWNTDWLTCDVTGNMARDILNDLTGYNWNYFVITESKVRKKGLDFQVPVCVPVCVPVWTVLNPTAVGGMVRSLCLVVSLWRFLELLHWGLWIVLTEALRQCLAVMVPEKCSPHECFEWNSVWRVNGVFRFCISMWTLGLRTEGY